MSKKNNHLTTSGMLLGIGILLPMVFHYFNIGGQIFLPMHFPIIIGGFLLPWQYAGALGLVTPLLSFFITSMPPAPGVFCMMAELFTYGVFASITYRYKKWGIYKSLITSMIAGRLVSITGKWFLLTFILGMPFDFLKTVFSLFVISLPGIIIQLIIIPVLVKKKIR